MSDGVFVFATEARGEFLAVERIRRHLRELGRESLHVTASADDVTAAEREASGVVVLEEHRSYRPALSIPAGVLAAEVDAEQRRLGSNLRRTWKADLRSWREGAADDEMARLALATIRAWRSILEEPRRIAGLWGEDGGHLVKQGAFLVGAEQDVPRWFVYVCPLPARLLVLDNPLNRFDRAAFEATDPTEQERDFAESFLTDIRAGRVQFATPRDLSFGAARVARFSGLLLDSYVRKPPGHRSLYPLRFARLYGRQRAVRAALRPTYAPLGARPFVFYPIHAGFDAQVSIRAPQWENQLALIEHLASSLPYGYELAIKEHPFEVGALRYVSLRALMRRRPEIRLLDPTIHAHTVLRACAAVATINSTTGFEAIFFRRPVLTYGHGPYRGLGLTRDVESPFDSPHLLLEALTEEPLAEETIVRLVTFLDRNSYPGFSLAYDVGDENVRRHAEIFADLARRPRLVGSQDQ